MNKNPAVELIDVSKRFGAVQANDRVSMRFARGSIHSIIGENGAGKSTVMSILYGYYRADSGEIRVDGRRVDIASSHDAIALGIGMVHQHFMLVDTFTVLENIALGAERGFELRSSLRHAREHLMELNREYGLEVDPDAIVGELGVGLQQRVEILKALYRGAETLILDEPTAVLTPQEADHLFRILRALRDEGKTVVLITHKLREVMDASDEVTVMRAGAVVGQVRTAETSVDRLAELMVGRQVNLKVAKAPREAGAPVLQVRNLSLTDGRGCRLLDRLNFEIRAGEIVGIAGVAGNGQSELLQVLAGLREPGSGDILYRDRNLADLHGDGTRAAQLRDLGIAHVPEDRMREGLVGSFPLYENAALGYQRDGEIQRGPLLSRRAMIRRCRAYIEQFDIRPANALLRAGLLSGGNQQKVVLAREIHADPHLLLIGQPTRGVDIGAIEFIHRRLIELRDAGKAILLVSVELDEILALSDRILVMAGGRISGELAIEDATPMALGRLMGGDAHPEPGDTIDSDALAAGGVHP